MRRRAEILTDEEREERRSLRDGWNRSIDLVTELHELRERQAELISRIEDSEKHEEALRTIQEISRSKSPLKALEYLRDQVLQGPRDSDNNLSPEAVAYLENISNIMESITSMQKANES
jgi:hypothetical protein